MKQRFRSGRAIAITTAAAIFIAGPVPSISSAATSTGADIQLSSQNGGTSYAKASETLGMRWRTPGGDWIDKNGVVNGPDSNIVVPLFGSGQAIKLTGMTGDVLVRFERTGGSSAAPPKFSAMTCAGSDDVFWVSPSTYLPFKFSPYDYWSLPAFIKNARECTLDITASAIYAPGNLRIDPVARVSAADWPMQGPSNKPDLFDFANFTEAGVTSTFTSPTGYAYSPVWSVDKAGFKFVTVGNALTLTPPANNQRLVKWEPKKPVQMPNSGLYVGELIRIERDVATGMNELGVKLSGVGSGNGSTQAIWAYVFEHSRQAPDNPDLYGLRFYIYDAEGQQRDEWLNVALMAGKWYWLEMYLQRNTFNGSLPNKDGVLRAWVNGRQVYERTNVLMTTDMTRTLNGVSIQLYHGGMGMPKGPMHYSLGRHTGSSVYTGPPAEAIRAGY